MAIEALNQMKHSPYMSHARNVLFGTNVEYQRQLEPLKDIAPVEREVISEFTIGGVIDLSLWWLRSGDKKISLDQLAEMYIGMIMGVLGKYYKL